MSDTLMKVMRVFFICNISVDLDVRTMFIMEIILFIKILNSYR